MREKAEAVPVSQAPIAKRPIEHLRLDDYEDAMQHAYHLAWKLNEIIDHINQRELGE